MTHTLPTSLRNIPADLRYALRGLRNASGYTLTVILTLALGLGAVTAMLAIVDSVLLRPVALPHPEQLVTLSLRSEQDGGTYPLSYPVIDALRRDAHSFSSVSAYNTALRPVIAADGSRTTLLTAVSPDLFATLGLHPRLGRLFTPADEAAPVAVVSAAFWRDRLNADPRAIGSTIRLSGQLDTVIGVLPEGVRFPQGTEAPVVYTPLSLSASRPDDLFGGSAAVMARLKPGISLPHARDEARSIVTHADPSRSSRRDILDVHSYADSLTGNLRSSLFALLGGVFLLLLIACANAANLQIARVTGRLAEINVRSALGASFGRLMQQVLTESLVVSFVGAAIGGALASALITAARHAYGQQFPRFDELAVHPLVFGLCALLAVMAGSLASLAPMLRIRRHTGAAVATTARTTQRSRVPGLLVIAQIALTCVLLMTSGLFVRTLRALQDVKLGFDPRNVTTLVLLPEDQHKAPEASRQTVSLLLERLSALPGVQSATMQSSIPFSNFNVTLDGTTEVTGRPFHDGDRALYSLVSSDFVRSSGMHLLRGRDLLREDESSAAMVALVNETFARAYLSARDPVGAGVKLHRNPGDTDADMPFTQTLTVVGVVEDELQGGDLGAPRQPMVYLDYRQLPTASGFVGVFSIAAEFAIRSLLPEATLSAEVRQAIRQAAPDMAEMTLQPMDAGIAQSLSQRRLALRLVAGFGAVALLLASIGIYGVLAYSVTQRRREIGIRMALGSSRGAATRLVLHQAGVMMLAGSVLGTAAAWPAGRAVQSFLFGVKPLDPWTLSTSALILLLVCAIAATVPAWRAAQVDPMEALRTE